MFSAREVPWHRIGTVVPEELHAREAIIQSGLDYEVELAPAFAQIPGETAKTTTNAYFPVANIDGEYEFIGNATRVVSNKYEVLQNRDAFTFMDNLVDEGLKYETAGSLRNRAWVWMTAKLPGTIAVGGEDLHDVYLLLSNSHDGTKAVRVDVTPVRVVCANTLNMAWGDSRSSWSARHLSTMSGRIDEARQTMDLTFKYLDDWKIQSELLLAEVFTDRQLSNLLDKLIPEGPRASKEQKATIRTLFNASPTIQGTAVADTRLGALNAVGEYFDHIRFSEDDERRTPQSQALGTWEGIGKKMRDQTAELLLAGI
jgi:phage/plasmid-like protein (TIGR03299 family)